ncbi:hypothetical protein GOV06_00870 [Candidatus Woesearchaeota archaeon]|nr:hypothetical protein [Candidatus Woesearchaeota archaeon]
MKRVFDMKKQLQPGIGFPLLLIVIGVYYLLRDLGYIQQTVAFWPIILISIGVYWLTKRIVLMKQ